MTQPHNPPSECPRLGGADPAHKALRTVHGTAVSGMWVNGTCPCDPKIARQLPKDVQRICREED